MKLKEPIETNMVCHLCKGRSADKKNSHIIPKFMCKSLFQSDDIKPNQKVKALSIQYGGKSNKEQDSPKEDHILCSDCESRFGKLEDYFARRIEEIHGYLKYPEDYKLFSTGGQEYLLCENIHPSLFKLFIYSLVWRASISKLKEFKTFKLLENVEEEIRIFLDTNLYNDQKLLLASLDHIAYVPQYHSCLIKPKERSEHSRGILSVNNMTVFSHILLLVDFGLFFYTDETSIGNVLRRYSNKQNQKVIITLGELEPWLGLNQITVSKLFKK